MTAWTKMKGTFLIFLLPVLLWVTIFFFLPMMYLWLCSFGQKVGFNDVRLSWSLQNYVRVLDPLYLKVIWNSVWIAFVTTAITLLISMPIALAISQAPSFWRPWLLFLVVLPFWANLLIRTYAFIIILRMHGLLNVILEKMCLLLHIPFEPAHLLYTRGAVVAGLVYTSLPLMILPLYLQLERVDKMYAEASADLGAGSVRTFFNITLPLIFPGVVSGIVLTFTANLGAYLVPDLLGGAQGGIMISNVISAQFKNLNDWPFGSALGFVLIYFTFVLILLKSLLVRRRFS